MMKFNRPRGMAGMLYNNGGKGPGNPNPPAFIMNDPKFENVKFIGSDYEGKVNKASGFGGYDFRYDLEGVKFYGMEDDGLIFIDQDGNAFSAERDYKADGPGESGDGYGDMFSYLQSKGAEQSKKYNELVSKATEKKLAEPSGPVGTIINKNEVITGSGDPKNEIFDLREGREGKRPGQLRRGLRSLQRRQRREDKNTPNLDDFMEQQLQEKRLYAEGGKTPGEPKRATMSEQAIIDTGQDDAGFFVVYETAGGDKIRVAVPENFQPEGNVQYDIVDFGEGFKVEFPDDRQREEASSGEGLGPEDAPGQRGDMFAKGGLVGGQKKLDKNNDGKISGEDFKILRSMMKGGKMNYDQGGKMQQQGPGGLVPVGEGEVLKDPDGRAYVMFEDPKGEGSVKVYSPDYGWNEVEGVAQRDAQGMGPFTAIPMDMDYPVTLNEETGEYQLDAAMYDEQMSKRMERDGQANEGFRGSIKREIDNPGSTQSDRAPGGAPVGGLLEQLKQMGQRKANKGMRVIY